MLHLFLLDLAVKGNLGQRYRTFPSLEGGYLKQNIALEIPKKLLSNNDRRNTNICREGCLALGKIQSATGFEER